MFQPQVGASLEQLDTPAMLVDLTLMEANIVRLMERLRASQVQVRPHLKTVKSPDLARLLLQAGAVGGCVAKVSEAEVMVQAGVHNLLITTEIVGAPKLARLIALLPHAPQLTVVVDSLEGAQTLNRALEEAGQQISVLIDVNVGQNRCGVQPGEEARQLAQGLRSLHRLRVKGVQGYEGHLQHVPNAQEREQRCRAAMQQLTATADLLRADGFAIEVVTTGGTGTAEICATCSGVTEVQPGSFIFMDIDYRRAIGPVYANALSILSTVLSRPTPTRAVIDAGLKSLSTDSGMPELKGWPEIAYRPGGDEHGLLTWADQARSDPLPLTVGERVEVFPSHIDTTVNLHDWYYAHRHGRLESTWPVAARGKVQ